MKKHLLLIGTLILATMFIVACSSSNDPDPEPEDPNTEEPEEPEEPGEPTYEYIHLVDAIKYEDGSESYKFQYNEEFNLVSVKETISSKEMNFSYTQGRLTGISYYDGINISFTYNDNTIMADFEGMPQIIYTFDENEKIQSAELEYEDWSGMIKISFGYVYDENNHLLKITQETFVDGVSMGVDDMYSFKYDDKNSFLYSNILPEWYYYASIIGLKPYPINSQFSAVKFSPVNNIIQYTSGSGMFAATNYFQIEYNENGYPEKITQLMDGQITQWSEIVSLSYEVIEIEVSEEED